jgi:hypothetical protein
VISVHLGGDRKKTREDLVRGGDDITQYLLSVMVGMYTEHVQNAVSILDKHVHVQDCFQIASVVNFPQVGNRSILDVYDALSDKLLLLEGEIVAHESGNTATCYTPQSRGGAVKKSQKPKWIKTDRKVTVKGGRGKPAAKKTVYRNAANGELRVCKMVARSDGSKRASYVKF